MALFVASDLHLDEDHNASRLFRDERQGAELSQLAVELAAEPEGELVLLGDALDLTSMLPPERGLERFFRKLDAPVEPAPPRPLAELVRAIAASNPRAWAALRSLAERGRLTLVPGNHDHPLGGPEGRAALEAAGLGRARVEPSPVRRVAGRAVVLQHGHAFDPANARPGGSGEVLTRCVHQALLPWLAAHQARANVRVEPDRVVALRPEDVVLPVLRRWLDPAEYRRFFDAFMELLAENGYLPLGAAFLHHLVTERRVQRRSERLREVWDRAGRAAAEALEGTRQLPHRAPRPDVLVLGHTHTLDWLTRGERLYVNLGTWTERASDACGPRDLTLPLLRLAERGGELEARLVDLADAGRELQRYQAGATAPSGWAPAPG